MKRQSVLVAFLMLAWAWPVLGTEDAAEGEGEGLEAGKAAPGDGTVSNGTGAQDGASKDQLLARLKEALAKPDTAAAAVRELGPRINDCEAIKLILRAAADQGKNHPDRLEACKDAIRKMDAAQAVPCLGGVKRMGLSSAGEAVAYQILGEFNVEDGPRPSPNEKTLYEQRRDALLTGLSTSYAPITVAAAEAISRTGDKKAVDALIQRLPKVGGGAAQKAIGAALEGLTGRSAMDPAGWKSWYETEGASKFPPPSDPGRVGDPASDAAEAAWEYEYYGIPVKSLRMSFVIDQSESMGPEEGPAAGDYPRASAQAANPENWVEREQSFSSKCKLAKYELIATILQMPENAKFNIVYFGKGVDLWPQEGHLIQATIVNKNKAIDRILAQRLTYGTQLIEAMEVGWRNKEVDTIFLLSDGRPGNSRVEDPNEVVEIIKQNCTGKRKITVNAVDMNELPYLYKGRWRTYGFTGLCSRIADATGGKSVVFKAPKAPFNVKTKAYKPGGGKP